MLDLFCGQQRSAMSHYSLSEAHVREYPLRPTALAQLPRKPEWSIYSDVLCMLLVEIPLATIRSVESPTANVVP